MRLTTKFKIEALRRLGEMLSETQRNEGGRPPKESGAKREPVSPTLADLGLDKKTSSIAQRLADLPPEHFEQVRQGASTITKAIREVEHARRPAIHRPPFLVLLQIHSVHAHLFCRRLRCLDGRQ